MKLWVGGMRAGGSGYPNAANTLRILRDSSTLDVVDLGQELPQQLHLWRIVKASPAAKLASGLKLLLGNLVSAARVLCQARGANSWVYVPYPSLFFMLWMSLVPVKWRPRCIVDSYISLWDAAFRDRSNSEGRGFTSKIVKAAETRALGAAHHVLVDTTAHREMFIREFGLAPSKVDAFPLALPPSVATASDKLDVSARSTLRILFIGTFVPLHGVDAILEGVAQLLDRADLEFRFIGDGQEADIMSRFIARPASARVTWERGWLEPERMREEISQADICIGVFGGTGKAARVLPLKLYHYLAAGKAIITQNDHSLPGKVPSLDGVVVLSSRLTLAEDLTRMIQDADLRRRMGEAASSYFKLYLSDEAIVRRWLRLIEQKARDY